MDRVLNAVSVARVWRAWRKATLPAGELRDYSSNELVSRLSRWLLVAGDRLGLAELPFTHLYIAHALAVRRAGITAALGGLVRKGAITCGRGRISILDESRLKTVSCDCQNVILAAHEQSLRTDAYQDHLFARGSLQCLRS
jgi:hypothetical protein